MKHLATKPLGLALVMAALFLSVSQRAYGYVISAYPDSVVMTTAVGSSTTGYVSVSTSWDTLNGLPSQMTISLSLAGSSQFTFVSDSIMTFRGNTYVQVRYSPTSDFTSESELTIVGDSNTVHVQLIGNPVTHFEPQITVENYDSIQANQQTCENFSVHNSNPDTIWVSQVLITDDPRPGTQWSLDSTLSLPIPIPGNSSRTLGEICAYVAASDSNLTINGSLWITYTYGTITDSISTNLEGRAWENGACVTASSGYFGTIQQGASVTKTITLTNTTDSSVYLYSNQIVGANAGEFTLNSPSFPLVLPMDSSVDVSITFASDATLGQGGNSAEFDAAISGMSPDDIPCNDLAVPLYANVEILPADSITLNVPPGTSTLSITGHTLDSRHAIFIQNDTSRLLELQSISASSEDTGAWPTFEPSGGSTQYLSDSLAAGNQMGPIILSLHATDTGTFTLDLTLNFVVQQAHQKGAVPTSSSSYTYKVIAHRLPPLNEAVSEPNAPASADFALMPNPARDEVTIVLPDNGASSVEIYDVLGNLVLNKVAQGNFVWNGETGAGALANGTYIVRVRQGIHTSSKRLVIVR